MADIEATKNKTKQGELTSTKCNSKTLVELKLFVFSITNLFIYKWQFQSSKEAILYIKLSLKYVALSCSVMLLLKFFFPVILEVVIKRFIISGQP